MSKKRRHARQRRVARALRDLNAAYHYTWALRTMFQDQLERSDTGGDYRAGIVAALEALEHDLKSVLTVLERLFQWHPPARVPLEEGGNGLLRDL